MNEEIRNNFIRAIHDFNIIKITFFSKEDNSILERICAPMDYGPSRRDKLKNDKFHFWDFDSDSGSHTLSLSPNQVRSIEITSNKFDPAKFIKWDVSKSPWFITRNWGEYS